MSQTLYSLCVSAAVESATGNKFSKEYRVLPDHVLFDFYYKIYTNKRLCLLSMEFSDFSIFSRMLRVLHKRMQLLQCFQALIDHGANIANVTVNSYTELYDGSDKVDLGAVDLGLCLGTFLSEGAWYKQSHAVFNVVEQLCKTRPNDAVLLRRLLDCYHRRIFVESAYCMFKEAQKTFNLANKTVEELRELNSLPNLAGLYANFSNLFGMRSEYEEAYKWSKKAVKLLTKDLPSKMIIQVLRQASRSCVLKRRFSQAGLLIEQAVLLADGLYEIDKHPSYSDTLTDYGFYLLNYDNIEQSVLMFVQALAVRKEVFGKNNMRVAVAYEDLAYALYVNEYSSGKFFDARDYAEKAIKIMEKILPKDHLALASTKRIKALILEEIAVDIRDPWAKATQGEYLLKAEQLHRSALELSLSVFGERNVQTAKHYGNLGRLYQSMSQYEKAEQMHLQAVAIKEELLGEDDYEVGLSVGHLASLYTFHMKRYQDAEKLYLRSIKISLKLFGHTYSGLEYDYRGLINVYTELQYYTELLYFTNVMRDWKFRRESLDRTQTTPQPIGLDIITKKFFELC